MFVEHIEKVFPCMSDPWKLRIIAYLDSKPDLLKLSDIPDARYSESLGVVLVRLGRREVNFFASGKVTIREVSDIEEGKKLVNSILAMSEHRQMLKEKIDD
jgi:ArsR family metal-binding transcriptional regulator